MTKTPLVCPECGSENLRSDEVAAIGYPVHLFRTETGDVDVEYTGEDREVWDEDTVYSGDIWCRDCGNRHAEADLITQQEEVDV